MRAERETLDNLLIVDPDVRRAARLAMDLGSASRDVRIACDLATAFEQIAVTQPDLVLVETALLATSGMLLADRVTALAPWAPLIATAGPQDPGTRRAMVRRYELHAIHDGNSASLDELVEAALASARRSRARLAESELREVIVAKLCHEMRTCLYVIEGYAEILVDAGASQGGSEVAARIGSTSHLALGLVQDYLDLARLEPRAGEADVAPVELDRLLDDLRADVRRRSGCRALRLEVVGTVPAGALAVDADQLRAVLGHLVRNVAERSRHEVVRIEARTGAAATEILVASDADAAADASRAPSPTAATVRDDVSLSGIRGQGLALAIAFRMSRMLGATLDDMGDATRARFRLRIPARGATSGEPRAQESTSEMPILH